MATKGSPTAKTKLKKYGRSYNVTERNKIMFE